MRWNTVTKKEMRCEELSDQMQNGICVTIQNMGIYDRCEKDVKKCRPHSLKPEDGLLRHGDKTCSDAYTFCH